MDLSDRSAPRAVVRVAEMARDWPRPPLADVALAAGFVLLTVLERLLVPDDRAPAGFALGVVAMVSLAWRRSFPLAVAALVITTVVLTDPDGQFAVLLSLVLAAFTVGAETGPPRDRAGLAILVVPFLAGLAATKGLLPSDVAAAVVFLVGPWLVGTTLRKRTAHAAEALARAERAERDWERQAAEAAEAERVRIARELHDIVSHSISVVTIQTQAVRRRLGPDHAREAADLAAVEATAREAMAEMRRLFGMLRGAPGTADLAPQPGLAELSRLVAGAGTPDVAVELHVEGEPYPLPPGVDLAAYRILQEGITNALRHSGAARIEVRLAYRPGEVEVAVEDDGRGGAGTGGGHGLVGVRERVSLYEGRVSAGPRPGGGHRLAAALPTGDRS